MSRREWDLLAVFLVVAYLCAFFVRLRIEWVF